MPRAFRDDGSVNVIVETPRGSQAKFKHDPETDAMMLSRPLPDGIVYPYDWGFIPSTHAEDGDPLDAMILWDRAGFPGLVVPSRIVGMLRVEQKSLKHGGRERNDRLFALPIKSPRHDHITTIFDFPERIRAELEQFFLTVVAFEGKEVRLLGFDGPEEAERMLRAALVDG